MSKIDENSAWELEAPKLASLSRETPFTVPDGYFEHLAEHTQNSIFLSTLAKNDGFSVPNGYFENLAQQIGGRIALENLPTQETGFAVPAAYFEKLHEKILSKTTNTPKVKKLWQQPWLKYASAACLAVLFGSGYYYNQYQERKLLANVELQKEQLLYDIDESIIREHVLETQNASLTQDVSDEELESYILDHMSSTDIRTNL